MPQGPESGSTPVTTATPEASEAIASLKTPRACGASAASGVIEKATARLCKPSKIDHDAWSARRACLFREILALRLGPGITAPH